MALTLEDLLHSPDHYLHAFEGDDAIFVPMDRSAYHRSIFLDDRISAASSGWMRVSLKALTPTVPEPLPVSWIFHVAHCGSTLLARALDQLETNLVLREPRALRQFALAPDAARHKVVRAMLGKRYAPQLPTVIKANVPVNFIMADLVAPQANAILLYCSLRNYLLGVLRSPNHRSWLAHVSEELKFHIGGPPTRSHSERGAALWLSQMRIFSSALKTMPNARALDAAIFFESPRATLKAAAGHLNISMTETNIERIVAGPLFSTDAKRPMLPFDNNDRNARNASLEIELAEELESARRWLEDAAGSAIDLDRPLI